MSLAVFLLEEEADLQPEGTKADHSVSLSRPQHSGQDVAWGGYCPLMMIVLECIYFG